MSGLLTLRTWQTYWHVVSDCDGSQDALADLGPEMRKERVTGSLPTGKENFLQDAGFSIPSLLIPLRTLAREYFGESR